MATKEVVLITGANTGLGLEIVRSLYRSSTAYEILVGCRRPSAGEEAIATVQKEASNGGSSLSTVQVDISSDESIEKAFETVKSKYGKLDVLVNNAGGNFDVDIRDGKLSTREGWNQSWNINVAGTQVMTEVFVPLLLKSSNPRVMFMTSGTSSIAESERTDGPMFGRINGAPPAGWPKDKGLNPIASYRSAKAGMNMMVREWSRLLRNDGVKVFSISPGFLATGLAGIGADKLKQMGAKDPSEGGNFVRDVIQGARDKDDGKAIRADMIQPW